MEKPADVQFHIHDLLRRRWSPRAFADKPAEQGKIKSLLEAARWASSCFNEQPWVFILASIECPESHQKLLSCLVEGNQIWAKRAPLLLLTVAKLHFDHNGEVNRHAYHDFGLAVEAWSCNPQPWICQFIRWLGFFLTPFANAMPFLPAMKPSPGSPSGTREMPPHFLSAS